MIKIFDILKFSVIPNLNTMGNEIKKPRPFFWLVLRLWRPTLVRFFNLDVSSSISLDARQVLKNLQVAFRHPRSETHGSRGNKKFVSNGLK